MSRSNSPAGGDLPKALPSMWRIVKLGYRAEPRGLIAAFVLTVLRALPDVLVALWLVLITNGVIDHRRSQIVAGALGLAASATAMWYLSVALGRIDRRLRDRLSITFQAHVANLQASVPSIEHHERPEYLDRLSVLRNQVFALDHLFGSLFSTLGWIVRLVFAIVLLASIHPLLALLALFAVPIVAVASWRPKIERVVDERVAADDRLARHLFTTGTSTPPAKEVRVAGTQAMLVERRGSAWRHWYREISATRWLTALWQMGAWALFAAGFVSAIAWVATGLDASPGKVVLALVAGSRLSAYVNEAVAELGFLRGIWLDSAQRLAWLEDYAAAQTDGATLPAPTVLRDGIRFEDVSFAYPGTDRAVLDHIDVHLPAGSVVAVVGENGAGKTTLVKLLARMYPPTSGRITVDGNDLAQIDCGNWRERMSGAFQDFARLEFQALTTVGLGDEPHHDDRAAVGAAVWRAGAGGLVDQLRDGLDTQLGPAWDGGVDVSFGQWQKFALARGYMRDEPLVLILDEPTAALDAETEHALFEHYAQSARQAAASGRITVLVSHRFSTVRMADQIVVLDGANVVEVGTHEALIDRGGTYAELYRIQAAAYR